MHVHFIRVKRNMNLFLGAKKFTAGLGRGGKFNVTSGIDIFKYI